MSDHVEIKCEPETFVDSDVFSRSRNKEETDNFQDSDSSTRNTGADKIETSGELEKHIQVLTTNMETSQAVQHDPTQRLRKKFVPLRCADVPSDLITESQTLRIASPFSKHSLEQNEYKVEESDYEVLKKENKRLKEIITKFMTEAEMMQKTMRGWSILFKSMTEVQHDDCSQSIESRTGTPASPRSEKENDDEEDGAFHQSQMAQIPIPISLVTTNTSAIPKVVQQHQEPKSTSSQSISSENQLLFKRNAKKSGCEERLEEEWRTYFIYDEIKDKTECRMCLKTLSGRYTYSLKRHLLTMHKEVANDLGVKIMKRKAEDDPPPNFSP